MRQVSVMVSMGAGQQLFACQRLKRDIVVPVWLQAGLWGLVSCSALIIGSLFVPVKQRVVAAVMALVLNVIFAMIRMNSLQAKSRMA